MLLEDSNYVLNKPVVTTMYGALASLLKGDSIL